MNILAHGGAAGALMFQAEARANFVVALLLWLNIWRQRSASAVRPAPSRSRSGSAADCDAAVASSSKRSADSLSSTLAIFLSASCAKPSRDHAKLVLTRAGAKRQDSAMRCLYKAREGSTLRFVVPLSTRPVITRYSSGFVVLREGCTHIIALFGDRFVQTAVVLHVKKACKKYQRHAHDNKNMRAGTMLYVMLHVSCKLATKMR